MGVLEHPGQMMVIGSVLVHDEHGRKLPYVAQAATGRFLLAMPEPGASTAELRECVGYLVPSYFLFPFELS